MGDLFNPSLAKFVPIINCDCFFIFLEFVQRTSFAHFRNTAYASLSCASCHKYLHLPGLQNAHLIIKGNKDMHKVGL